MTDKFKLIESCLDQVKFYINPEIYNLENKKEEKEDEYSHKNSYFNYMSTMGKETGKLYVPKIMEDALKKIKDKKREQTYKITSQNTEELG